MYVVYIHFYHTGFKLENITIPLIILFLYNHLHKNR